MADLNPDNAFIYGSELDAVWLAPLGTPLPSTFNEPLNPAFQHVGWLSESDGINESQTGSTTKIRGHQGGGVVRKIGSEAGLEYAFTAYETKDLTLGIRYRERDVTVSGGVRRSKFSTGLNVKTFAAVIDFRDKGDEDAGERVVIERFEVSATGDRQAVGTGIAAIPMVGEIIGNNNERFVKAVAPEVSATQYTVAITGTPTGGTFALRVAGFSTAPLAHNVASAAVASAINALSGVTGISGVTATGAGPITVTFPAPAVLDVGTVTLTGGTSPNVTITAV